MRANKSNKKANSQVLGSPRKKSFVEDKDSSVSEMFWEAYEIYKEEKLIGDKFPSKIRSKIWLQADKIDSIYPLRTKRSGKWCVFVYKEEHDQWWDRIKDLLFKGSLGQTIKTNTAHPNPLARGRNKAVIIVYTYDSNDKDDVIRIRDELRKIGVTWKIPYKTDIATHKRKYEKNGDQKISLYFE